MRRLWILGGALALFAMDLSACGGDDEADNPTRSRPDASVDASGSVDAGRDTSVADATPDAPIVDSGTDADAALRSYAIFVGTDFKNAELSAVALTPDSIAGRLALADQDSVALESNGFGFALERAIGKVVVLDRAEPWKAVTTVDINDKADAAIYTSNPHTLLLSTGKKGYVARYASNKLLIVDVGNGSVVSTLDLSSFLTSDDPDGRVEVEDAVYDPASKRAYFLLQRIDQFDFSGSAPDYVAKCLPSHGALVAIDATNNNIVDLNGAAAGNAIELLGDNPGSLTEDFANGKLVVVSTGCYQANPDGGATTRRGRGIEAITVATSTPKWLYQTTDLDRLGGLVWVDDTHAFVNKNGWYAWNPTQTSLGAKLDNFPRAPVYDKAGARVLGLAFGVPNAGADAGTDAGRDGGTEAGADAGAGPVWTVVAWNIATSQVTTVATNPFQTVVPSTFGVSSALIR